MALLSHTTKRVGSESLEGTWEEVGSGGFGRVYKARHKDWGFDVAIKLLHDGVGSFIDEATHMDEASCEYVLRVYGVFEGHPPFNKSSIQKGIVMEFVGRGSIQTLQRDLKGPPPFPLVFRLAHEVALGMNFLHLRHLMHSDLKPSNVLLNNDLHAKLADFGLSRVSTSALNSNRGTTEKVGGSYKYMPPEAFEVSYTPVRAFDIYSYGILLWSIVTGKEPYERADYSLVALKIPLGDRPLLEDIDQNKAEGLKELVDLMKRCWDGNPSERPKFKECSDVTENLFSKHEKGILDAVKNVLTRQASPGVSSLTPELPRAHEDTVDHRIMKVEKSSEQDLHPTEKAKFVDDKRWVLIQRVSEVMAIVDKLGDMVHPETYLEIENEPRSQEQMRKLFQMTFRSGGVKVKAAFYDILREDHPNLVESLSKH
ncbi:Ankyrin repeat and protein kinase domain-containing protein 1 [Channa argus]|uniref:Ankyrin repeat and protein kinase domain-containing protein 1 n=1 Tax=Channa argus TaxID=215402 RepID=A0A6G1PFV2_CHAAH|nr:Ankyrin repeat and protein kinase domain-containing protein 1 [Channa argus]KAK2917929.1 hypothetical protein Q8A73_004675 [Channa argus]